jgi:hypothetical protein
MARSPFPRLASNRTWCNGPSCQEKGLPSGGHILLASLFSPALASAIRRFLKNAKDEQTNWDTFLAISTSHLLTFGSIRRLKTQPGR